MHDDEEDDNIMHYTTPMWCHLLIFGFAVSIAVGICQTLLITFCQRVNERAPALTKLEGTRPSRASMPARAWLKP